MGEHKKRFIKQFVIGFFGWFLVTNLYWFVLLWLVCKGELWKLEILLCPCFFAPLLFSIFTAAFMATKQGWRISNLGIPLGILIALLINEVLSYYAAKITPRIWYQWGTITAPFYFYLRLDLRFEGWIFDILSCF